MARGFQPLGPNGLLRIREAANAVFLLPLITAGTKDAPAGTTSERTYVNAALNPNRARTAPGGAGSFEFTYDENASAAVQALERIARGNRTVDFDWISNPVVAVKSGAASTNTAAVAIPDREGRTVLTFAGSAAANPVTDTDFVNGRFILIGNEVFVIDSVLSASTLSVHPVGTASGGIVVPGADYVAASTVAAAKWDLIVPAKVTKMKAQVNVGSGSIGDEAEETNATLNLTVARTVEYWTTVAQNVALGM